MTPPLDADEIAGALATLPGWTAQDGQLRKTFRLGSFREALSFIVRLGMEAEALDHHPEIRNVYSTVELLLTTHDAGNQITAKDVALARIIEGFSWV